MVTLFVLQQEERHQTLDANARIDARLVLDRLQGLLWAIHAVVAGLAAVPTRSVFYSHGRLRTLATLVRATTVGALARSALADGFGSAGCAISPSSTGGARLKPSAASRAAFPTVDNGQLLMTVLALAEGRKELVGLHHAVFIGAARLRDDGV